MKTFRRYLKEVAWQQSASKMIFNFDHQFSVKIPVSSAILDKVFPDKIRTTVFHVTDVTKVEKLVRLQKKQKMISAFFFMNTNYLTMGIKTGGGVVAELDGNIVVSTASDIMSMPDKTGRRWIEVATLSQFVGVEKDVANVIKNIADKYNPLPKGETDDDGIQGPYGRMLWDDDGLPGSARYKQLQEGPKQADVKKLSLIIKDYIDGMTAVLKKHKKGVEKALRGYSNKRVTKRSWDEQLVNQFTIKKVHVLVKGLWPDDDQENMFKMLKQKKIPFKNWENDLPGLATYISQVANAEMRTMGTK
jgi:hypothetical protein